MENVDISLIFGLMVSIVVLAWTLTKAINKCRHPAVYLFVKRDETRQDSKEFPGQFEEVTYHLVCCCGHEVDISYAKPDDEAIKRALEGRT